MKIYIYKSKLVTSHRMELEITSHRMELKIVYENNVWECTIKDIIYKSEICNNPLEYDRNLLILLSDMLDNKTENIIINYEEPVIKNLLTEWIELWNKEKFVIPGTDKDRPNKDLLMSIYINLNGKNIEFKRIF